MSSFDYFILGIIVSVPIAIAAPFGTTAIQKRLSTRNKKQGLRRIATLEREYAIIQDYHENQTKLLIFLGNRILILTVFWIGQTALDVVVGFILGGLNITVQSLNYGHLPISISFTSEWVGAVESLLDTIILAFLFRTGFRAYRIVRKVSTFDQYKIKVKNELATIREKDNLEEQEPDAQKI